MASDQPGKYDRCKTQYPVMHPELKYLGKNKIRVFLRDRDQYELQMQDLQATGASARLLSLKAFVDRDLILSLIHMGSFDATTYDALTDKELRVFLQEKCSAELAAMTKDDLASVVRTAVRMKEYESDPGLRITNLFTDYLTFLRSRNWESLVQDDVPTAVDHIVSLLKPWCFEKAILNSLGTTHKKLQSDWKAFISFVHKEYGIFDRYYGFFKMERMPATPRLDQPGPKGKQGNDQGTPDKHHRKPAPKKEPAGQGPPKKEIPKKDPSKDLPPRPDQHPSKAKRRSGKSHPTKE